MKKILVLLVGFVSLMSLVFGQGKTEIIYLNSKQVDCKSEVYPKCFQLKYSLKQKKWKNYMGEIRGFEYEEGHTYKLKVTKIMHEIAPSDGVDFYYKLIKIISKNAITKTIEKTNEPKMFSKEKYYIVDYLDSVGMTRVSEKKSFIQFDFTKKKIFGNDGCNSFFGSIKSHSDKEISFGPIAGTLMACMHLNNSDYKIRSLLEKVNGYSFHGSKILELLQNDKVVLSLTTDFESVPKLDGDSIKMD
ncbi:MAG: DUF4377 domain-containing protein [Bacteroidota bacterium]